MHLISNIAQHNIALKTALSQHKLLIGNICCIVYNLSTKEEPREEILHHCIGLDVPVSELKKFGIEIKLR